MSIRNEILKKLEESRGSFVSGGELSSALGVSRSAVWKTIKTLEAEGYCISAVRNKGYCLSDSSDILSPQSIKKHLKDESLFDIQVYKSLASTNTFLKELAAASAPEYTVVIAEEQTSGKGRLGRSFFSPPHSGIYMSILLRPNFNSEKSLFITTTAAVAVAQAIRQVTGLDAGIKWVNDIYIGEKKVCGILTEASLSIENNGLEYAVLGIGINVSTSLDAFPPEVRSIAASVLAEQPVTGDVRSRMIASILERFKDMYSNIGSPGFLEEYKKLSILPGRNIYIMEDENKTPAAALEIDDECHLITRLEDGSIRTLSSGEVSIRLN